MEATSLFVSLPADLPTVSIGLVNPTHVAVCEPLVLDASSSVGGAGRSLIFQWQLSVDLNPAFDTANELNDLAILNDLLTGSNYMLDVISVPNNELFGEEVGEIFNFTLTVSDWLGTTQNQTIGVSIDTLPYYPTLSVGASKVTMFPADETTIQVSSAPPAACSDSSSTASTSSAGSWDITYTWEQVAGQYIPLPTAQSRLVLPAHTFQSGEIYTLQVTVTYSDPASGKSSFASGLIDIEVQRSELVAFLSPGNQSA